MNTASPTPAHTLVEIVSAVGERVRPGVVVLRVSAHVVGQSTLLSRDYGCDPTSDIDRRLLHQLLIATGAPIPADDKLRPGDLIGRRLCVIPSQATWGHDLPPSDPDAALRARLLLTERGMVRQCGANIETILRESTDLRDRLRYDTLAQTIHVTDGPFAGLSTGLDVALANWLDRKWELHVSSAQVAEQILHVARRHGSYDPLVDYLTSIAWDGTPRIDTWLATYCRAEATDYHAVVGARWLIAGVARGLSPGAKVDTVLVFLGPQGAKKSTTFSVLGGPWYSDTPLVVGDKDSYIAASLSWIHEMAELASVRKADIEAYKAFTSASEDKVRPPYGRVRETFRRRCVFAGTTNDPDILQDHTGNRRYWIVPVGDIDIDSLRRDRDQLWAEAVVRYHAGEQWWLTDAEQAMSDASHERYQVDPDPWVPKLVDWIHRHPAQAEFVMVDLANNALSIKVPDVNRHKMHLCRAFRAAGLEPQKIDGRRVWVRKNGAAK